MSDDDTTPMVEFDYRITPEIAQHVLWQYRSGGLEPGRFTRALMDAAGAADPRNRVRLAMGFPGYVAAVSLVQDSDVGIRILRAIVDGHDWEIPLTGQEKTNE